MEQSVFGYPRMVQQPVMRPHHCAFITFLGASNGKGFFDSGTDFWGERIYCSFEAVENMAGQLGWVSPSDVDELRARVAVQQSALAAVEREVTELRAFKATIAGLEEQGAQIKRRPGRPRKTPQEAA